VCGVARPSLAGQKRRPLHVQMSCVLLVSFVIALHALTRPQGAAQASYSASTFARPACVQPGSVQVQTDFCSSEQGLAVAN